MLTADHTNDHERGASAILVAICMVLLLGVAAIAIDLGAGFNERRQDQTTADLGAVAGALSFGNKAAMVDQVLSVTRANLETVYSDGDWQAMWQSCTDPGRSAAFVPTPEPAAWGSGTLDCISLSPSFLRVRVPVQETETSFGRILGVDTLDTDAFAEVTVFPTSGQGALPFAIVAEVPSGEICLDTGPGGTSDPPCDGPSQGSFGNIAPPLFGNPFLNTQPECDQQTSSNNHVAESIAMGIDHILWKYPASSWTWSRSDNTSNNTVLNSSVNMDLCNEVTSLGETVAQPADGVLIDGVVVDTGNTVKDDITEGLISASDFSDGDPGRLWRTTGPTIAVRSQDDIYTLDNWPLWSHLLDDGDLGGAVVYMDSGTYAPASCDPDVVIVGTLDERNTKMRDCLFAYEAGTYGGQIFDDTILESPRFGVAPQLWHDNLGSGFSYRPIEQFRNVYLAGVWFDLQSHSPHEVFYPGETASEWCPVIKGGKCARILEVEQLTAFLLPDSTLSFEARSTYPGINLNVEVTITK